MSLRRVIELLEEQVGAWRDEAFITEEDIRRHAREFGYPEEEFTKRWLRMIGPRNPTPEEAVMLMPGRPPGQQETPSRSAASEPRPPSTEAHVEEL